MLALLLAGCRYEPTPHDLRRGTDTGLGDTATWARPGPSCELEADATNSNYLEGDEVAFIIACTDPVGAGGAQIVPAWLPEGARFDLDSGAFFWQTGVADAGRIELVFYLAADPSEVPTPDTVVFWVADDPANADNIPVDPLTYTEEWGLPVIHIQADDEITQDYSTAAVTWYGRTYAANVKIRGRTSTHYPKNSYALKFDDEEFPIEAWGVTRDHFLLQTTFDDNSYVRQKLTYDLWTAIAEYEGEARLTPRTLFTVLYLNGAYWGLYLGLDRLDDEFLDQMGFEREANLYKAIDANANFFVTNADGSAKNTLHDGYEKEEGLPEDDFADLDALVAFTGNSSSEDLVDAAGAWFDVPEFMDWFLLVHYASAEDSSDKNSYLYHAPTGGPFRYAPWDFNQAWGQSWNTKRIPADYENYYEDDNRIFWALQSDPEANLAIWSRFSGSRDKGPFALEWQVSALDAYYAAIDPSAARDWEKWGSSYRSYAGWADQREEQGDWQDYQGEKDYLYQWVEDRAARFVALHP